MRHKSAKHLKVLSQNSGQSGHVFVAAHGHPNDPRQALPYGLPKCLNGAVGHTTQSFLARARVITPCSGSCSDFPDAKSGKMGRARGSGGEMRPKGARGTGSQCRVVPCPPCWRRSGEDHWAP